MSYNISTVKKLEFSDLSIPWKAFFMHEHKDWHPKVLSRYDEVRDALDFRLQLGETCIVGDRVLNTVTVRDMELDGEGSGTAWEWIWKPAIIEGTKAGGKFRAVFVWEDGDSITIELIENGTHTSRELEF